MNSLVYEVKELVHNTFITSVCLTYIYDVNYLLGFLIIGYAVAISWTYFITTG